MTRDLMEPPKVLLVEAQDSVRWVLAAQMLEAGFDVHSVGSCEDARREIALRRPRLSVVDDWLPDGRGVDLCRDLHDRAPDVALLLYAAVLSEEDRCEAIESGVSGIVLKTIDLTVLFRTMWELAGRHAVEGRNQLQMRSSLPPPSAARMAPGREREVT